MKKFYFMLISLLCTVFTAQAAKVTDLSQLSDDKVYTIRSERAFLLHQSGKLVSSNGKTVNATRNPQDANQQFRIEKSGSSYLLYSVGAGKYVMCSSANNVTFNGTRGSNLTLHATGNAAYPWKLQIGGFYLNSQDPNQTDSGLMVDSWSTTDAGNSYVIEEVTDGEDGGETDSNSQEVYDFTGFGVEAILELFNSPLGC